MFLSYANTPNEGVIHSPVLVNFSIIGFIIFIGIEKPIPSADVIFTEFIPKTSPFILMGLHYFLDLLLHLFVLNLPCMMFYYLLLF